MIGSLLLSWFLAFGYVPTQTECVNGTMLELDSSRIVTVIELGLTAQLSRLSVYGSLQNYQYVGEEWNFHPFRVDYTVGASLRLTDNVRIIAEHECDHPIDSSPQGLERGSYMSEETKLMIRIEGGGD